MSLPPNLPPTRRDPAPEGYHYEWALTEPAWQPYTLGLKRCRYTVGPGHVTCRKTAVATLNRGYGGLPSLWAYCADHLYGRTLYDGAIWHVRLVPDPTPDVQSPMSRFRDLAASLAESAGESTVTP